jgi:D-aminoacyl-tRNA deacylase
MKVLLQRVSHASVTVDNKVVGQIGNGLLLFVGVAPNDDVNDLSWMAEKCVNMRIFEDDEDKMNISLLDLKGEILVISQFTLMGDAQKGRRPSFIKAAPPEKGQLFYDQFIEKLKTFPVKVESGIFGAMMDIDLVNRGPVTLMIEK